MRIMLWTELWRFGKPLSSHLVLLIYPIRLYTLYVVTDSVVSLLIYNSNSSSNKVSQNWSLTRKPVCPAPPPWIRIFTTFLNLTYIRPNLMILSKFTGVFLSNTGKGKTLGMLDVGFLTFSIKSRKLLTSKDPVFLPQNHNIKRQLLQIFIPKACRFGFTM